MCRLTAGCAVFDRICGFQPEAKPPFSAKQQILRSNTFETN